MNFGSAASAIEAGQFLEHGRVSLFVVALAQLASGAASAGELAVAVGLGQLALGPSGRGPRAPPPRGSAASGAENRD